MQRRQGDGVTLDVDAAGGTTFVNVATIVDGYSSGGAKATTSDLSILTDVFMPFGKSQVDPGEVSFMIAFDPADGTSQLMATLLAQVGVHEQSPNWRFTFPAVGAVPSKSFQYRAWLTGMGDEVKKGKLVNAPITLKKSGNPGYSTS
jgi:hypothetical protein